jgi:hypothetical protein
MFLSFFLNIFPEYDVEVTMQGWFQPGMHPTPPSMEDKEWLASTHLQPSHEWKSRLTRRKIKYLGDVSDTLVFDYLVDDPDRMEPKNWISIGGTANDTGRREDDPTLILWDSGLGWFHGPFGLLQLNRPSLAILCGPEHWREDWANVRPLMLQAKINLKQSPQLIVPYCDTVCVFRSRTVERLKSLSRRYTENPADWMGNRLKEALMKDPLYRETGDETSRGGVGSIFRYGVFHPNETQQQGKLPGRPHLIRFEDEDFYEGMDFKVEMLLDHIARCINVFGTERVLLYDNYDGVLP